MKIISKYKDYYDYLQGIYGVDDKLVLDRRKFTTLPYFSNGIYYVVIGNLIVQVLYNNRVFYCGESDMIKLGGKKDITSDDKIIYSTQFDGYFGKKINTNIVVTPYICESRENDSVIYIHGNNYHNTYSYPQLEQLGIAKVLKPHDIWIELSNYLSNQLTKNEKEVPIGDDKVRIQSHGFDLKTSFRPNIKKHENKNRHI
jgi:hypothetical protein